MRKIATYLLVTVVWSWSWWAPLALSGTHTLPGMLWPTHLIGLIGPAVGAFITTAIFDGRAGVRALIARTFRWRVRWWWYAVIALTAVGAIASAVVDPNGALVYSGAPLIGPFVVVYVLILNGFGEEIGWRGFFADALLKRHSTGVTALVVWLVWGMWHLPLFWVVQNFIDLGVGGTIGWAAGILCGSVLLTWMYKASGLSILVVALWHTAYNFSTATESTAGVSAAVISTVVMAAAVVLLCLPSLWRKPSTASLAPANR